MSAFKFTDYYTFQPTMSNNHSPYSIVLFISFALLFGNSCLANNDDDLLDGTLNQWDYLSTTTAGVTAGPFISTAGITAYTSPSKKRVSKNQLTQFVRNNWAQLPAAVARQEGEIWTTLVHLMENAELANKIDELQTWFSQNCSDESVNTEIDTCQPDNLLQAWGLQ